MLSKINPPSRQVFEEERKEKEGEYIPVKEKARMIARQQQQIIEREESQRLEGKVGTLVCSGL